MGNSEEKKKKTVGKLFSKKMLSNHCHQSTLTTLYKMLPNCTAVKITLQWWTYTRLNLPHFTTSEPHTAY